MTFSYVPRPPRWLWWGALLVAAFIVLPLVLNQSALVLVADAVFLLVTGAATVVCVIAARSGSGRAAWIAAAAASGAWFIAQLAYVPKHLGAAPDAWTEAISDVASLLVVPSFFAGLVALAHTDQTRHLRREIALDVALALLAATAVAYEVVVGPIRDSSTHDRIVLGAIIGTQVLALLLICVATVGMIWRARALPHHVAKPLLAGFLACIAGSGAYSVTVVVSTYYPGCPADLPFLAGFILLGCAARRNASAAEIEPRLIDRRYLRWRAGLVAASVLAVGGLATYAAAAREQDSVVIAGVVLSTLLLAARVGLGASDHLRLDLRTRERDRLAAVIDLSAAIAGSLDPNEVFARLAEASARAAGRSHGRAVVIGPEGAVEVTAVVGFATPQAPVATDRARAALIAEQASLGAREVRWSTDPALAEALVQKKRTAGMLVSAVAPLVAGGTQLGYVEAWTPKATERFAPEDLAAVAAIGQQGGLAVRNAGLHAELEQRAGTDELTGVLNRRALLATLARELAAAREFGTCVGVLMIDVDGFKSCNDTHGHAAGDRMLRELAAVIGDCLEPGDLAGRYGGDEFVIVLPGAGRADTERTAELIEERARRTALVANGATLRLRLSIGTAIAPGDGMTADELIAEADRAMYVAKRDGRTVRHESLAVH